ncbi:MAG: LytR/AlgR family response regulator transcription factor [Lachnospiraceae bacterium]
MLRIAFCDNDRNYISYLKGNIKAIIPADTEIKFLEYYNVTKFLSSLYRQIEPDILFLNVQMPEMDGYTIAQKFRERYHSTILIFCSEIQFPEPKLLKVAPYRYLVKHYTDIQIKNELREIWAHLCHIKEIPTLWGSCEKTVYKLSPKDILYISITKRGCTIHLSPDSSIFHISGEMFIRMRLPDIYHRLCDYDFVYAHNSYIVNLRYITKCSKTELQLTDGNILTISRSRQKEFIAAFNKYQANMDNNTY